MHETTPRCFANHMGLYLCEPTWLMQAVALVRAGAYPLIDARPPTPRERLYHVGTDGVAVIPLSGPLFKGGSKFSSASTVDVRRAVRQARDDPEVRGILLHIDSPGGHVAGIQELADEVRATDKVKPVHAHLDDLGASAAYWVASQARHVTANATAQVGSIGVVAIVEDSSGAAELEGVKVHVVATGERKGDFAPGAPVTDEAIEALREEVADTQEHFLAAVSRGRGMRGKRLEAVADGRTWIASKAHGLGLLDAVASEDEAFGGMVKAAKSSRPGRRERAQLAIRLSRARRSAPR
ncbi:MAG: S49 family peptidase [Gemmatimonadota bacterium]|jgi:signal peptide peptidase SppA